MLSRASIAASIALVSTCLGVAWWLSSARGNRDEERVRPIATSHVTMEPSPISLQARQLRSPPKPRDAQEPPAPAAVESATVVPDDRVPPPQVTEEERRVFAESAFESEPYDAAWGRASRELLQQSVGSLLGASGRALAVECRSSLCRVDLEHETSDGQQEFLHQFRRSRVWRGGGMAVRLDPQEPPSGGPVRLSMYLAKEGRSLPEPVPYSAEH
jgi:hypothetical protein